MKLAPHAAIRIIAGMHTSYARSVRVLHALIALAVLVQLGSEQFMTPPDPDGAATPTGALLFGVHELIGFVVLILAAVRLSLLAGDEPEQRRLYPWLSPAGRAELAAACREELSGWLKGRLRDPALPSPLAGAIHGLGLLLALGLGATGAVVFIGMAPDGSLAGPPQLAKEIHGLLAPLMWVYLVGHVAMALLHELAGHRVLRRIAPTGAADRESG